MTDTRKQTLAEGFAAANKATFKPRSDIEGLGRKLRAIMRKVDVVARAVATPDETSMDKHPPLD
jgi:hypothetical protein